LDALVTIGMACFNAERSIGSALDSAISQDYPNIEIVIVDDNSSDSTQDIVEDYVSNCPIIRFVRNPTNTGAASVRNRLVDLARGEYIVFFDDDDVSHPTRVRTQVRYLKRFEALAVSSSKVLCFTSVRKFYPNGFSRLIPALGFNTESVGGIGVAKYILANQKDRHVGGVCLATCCLAARVESLKRLKFDPRFRRVEDLDLCVRASLENYIFVGCPEILVSQFHTVGSHKTSTANASSEALLIEKYSSILESWSLLGYAYSWSAVREHYFAGRKKAAFFAALSFITRFRLKALRHVLGAAVSRLSIDLKIRSRGPW